MRSINYSDDDYRPVDWRMPRRRKAKSAVRRLVIEPVGTVLAATGVLVGAYMAWSAWSHASKASQTVRLLSASADYLNGLLMHRRDAGLEGAAYVTKTAILARSGVLPEDLVDPQRGALMSPYRTNAHAWVVQGGSEVLPGHRPAGNAFHYRVEGIPAEACSWLLPAVMKDRIGGLNPTVSITTRAGAHSSALSGPVPEATALSVHCDLAARSTDFTLNVTIPVRGS